MGAVKIKSLFEDAHLIVLSKPAGLLSQGEATGDVNLVDELRNYFGRYYVGLVHRLDRNTSGLMVVAKRSKAAARLTESLQTGQLRRVYQAWLVGRLTQSIQWKHWLLKDEQTNKTQAFWQKEPSSKESILNAVPLKTIAKAGMEYTLTEFVLETGRSHQIRVQSAFEGYPLAGDKKYGAPGGKAVIGRPALHSAKIAFPHPMSGDRLCFEEELPEDMRWI